MKYSPFQFIWCLVGSISRLAKFGLFLALVTGSCAPLWAQNPPITFPLDSINFSNNAIPPTGSSTGFSFSLNSKNNGLYGWNVRIDLDSLNLHIVDLNPIYTGSISKTLVVEGHTGPGFRYLTLDTNRNLIFGTHSLNGSWVFDSVQANELAVVVFRAVELTNNHLILFWLNNLNQTRIWAVDLVQKTVVDYPIAQLPQVYATPVVIDSNLVYFTGYALPNSFQRIGINGSRSWLPVTHNFPAVVVPQTIGALNGSNWITGGYQDYPTVGFPTSSPILGKLDNTDHIIELHHIPYASMGSVQVRGHSACQQDQAHYVTYQFSYGNMAQFDSVVLVRLDPNNSLSDTLLPTWKQTLGFNQQYQNSGVYSDGVHVFTHNRYFNDSLGIYILEIKLFDAQNGMALRTEQFSVNPTLTVYPNPNNGNSWIHSPIPLLNYRIVNQSGHCIRNVNVLEPTNAIYLENIPQGAWFLEGNTGQKIKVVTRFVVN